MYIFSISLLFSGYYIDQVFALDLFSDATSDRLEELITGNDLPSTSFNIELIFGDFIKGAQVLFGVMTGDVITSAMHMIPAFNDSWDYAVRILFTTSTLFLWLNIITGRDL